MKKWTIISNLAWRSHERFGRRAERRLVWRHTLSAWLQVPRPGDKCQAFLWWCMKYLMLETALLCGAFCKWIEIKVSKCGCSSYSTNTHRWILFCWYITESISTIGYIHLFILQNHHNGYCLCTDEVLRYEVALVHLFELDSLELTFYTILLTVVYRWDESKVWLLVYISCSWRQKDCRWTSLSLDVCVIDHSRFLRLILGLFMVILNLI